MTTVRFRRLEKLFRSISLRWNEAYPPSKEMASSISLAVQTTDQLTRRLIHGCLPMGAVCCLSRGNSGCALCACSLILHPICSSPGMRFVVNCACWISGFLPARSEFLDAAERLVWQFIFWFFSFSVSWTTDRGHACPIRRVGLVFFIGRTLLKLDSEWWIFTAIFFYQSP